MANMPFCNKCQSNHWNIIPCGEAAENRVVAAEDARRDRNLRQPIRRARANDWGNRLIDTVEIAPGVIGLRRAPLTDRVF